MSRQPGPEVEVGSPSPVGGACTRSALRRARRKRAHSAEARPSVTTPPGAAYRCSQPVGRPRRPPSVNFREALPPAHFLVEAGLTNPTRLAGLLTRISRSNVGLILPGVNVAQLMRESAEFCAQMSQFAQKFKQLRLRLMLDRICPLDSQAGQPQHVVAARQVVRYLRAVVHKTGLLAVFGTTANQKWAVKCFRFYVCRPRLTKCPLGQLMAGLSVRAVSWLSLLPKTVAEHILAKFLGKLTGV